MRIIHDRLWCRGGISLLWASKALSQICRPEEVVSIREFFALSRSWPADLPSNGGNSLVVTGLEGCLDVLTPQDGEHWLERKLKPTVLQFQDEYEGQAALAIWLPSGRGRISMNRASASYVWRCGGHSTNSLIDFGRLFWAGAQDDVARILDQEDKNQDPDGPAWMGLFHQRIS